MKNKQKILHAALRTDLSLFIIKVFKTLNPGTEYKHNWHIDAIAHVLVQCHEGQVLRQAIFQPPRTLKSICTSVAFVAWVLGHNPGKSFICLSYSQDLALDLALKFRVIVESDWYQTLFPRLQFTKMTDANCITTQGGGRLATSIGGTFTGKGADMIILDDPLKAEDAHSETARKNVLTWYTNTLLSRFDDPGNGVLILVMQRLHEEDLAGAVTQDWSRLILPAQATEDQSIPIGSDQVHTFKKGDLLHAARLNQDYLDQMKKEIGSLAYSAQYQQDPLPVEGNLVKREWLHYYDELPKLECRNIVQSWDVAATLTGDYSVCTTWLVYKNHYYLVNVWRGRLEQPDLKRQAVHLAKKHGANTLLIEKAGVGLSFYQTMKEVSGVGTVYGITPKGEKLQRLEGVTPMIEEGDVLFPKEAKWLATYLHELLGVPGTTHDDQVDSTTQFLEWSRRRSRHAGSGVPGAMIIDRYGVVPPGGVPRTGCLL